MPPVSNSSLPTEAQEQTRSRIEVGYGNLPLSFEPNRGQTDPRVKFLSRAGNRTLWLTSDEAVLAVGRPSRPDGPDAKKAGAVKEDQIAPAVLRMKFVGANTSPAIEGEARQSGTVNYFAGKPNEWRTNIATYARVRYRSLYPGIDLVFYGNNRELEYDLVVGAGADPGRIKLAVAGADEVRIDAEGNLVLKTSQGEVAQQKPKVYQRKGNTLTAVAGDYVITGKDEVGFRLGSYDRNTAVVIDPVLRYSSFLGGSQIDEASTIAIDSSKRAVVGGFTESLDFPTTTGAPSSGSQAFITKFDFTGSHLVFSVFFSDVDSFPQLALDAENNIYVTGTTSSDHFPTTPGAFQRTRVGGLDAFAAKLNPSGTALIYSTLLGGTGDEQGPSIAIDPSGNAYITGDTGSQDFPTTSGAFQRTCKLNTFLNACVSAFVTKLNANGSQALYSTYLGGHGSQEGLGIAADRNGQAFVVGLTTATDFPTTAGSAQPVAPGSQDGFVTKISSSGSHLVYSTYLGGTGPDFARDIALDSLGNAYITGDTASGDFPVKNAFQPKGGPGVSPFVTKLSPSGTIVYSTYMGGSFTGDDGIGIAATPDGQAYVTGRTASQQFPTSQTAFQRVFGGANDIFITKFSPTGKLIYSSYLGGRGNDFPTAVALDTDTNAYLTGIADFQSPNAVSNFPVTPGAFQQKFGGGGGDAFVAKVVSLCALSTVNRTVTICSPGNGSTVASPVRIIAGTTDVTPVKLTQVYLDGKKIYETPLSAINVNLPIAGGTHRLTVQGLDTAGVFFKKFISINVSPH
ncbi:MAG: SBBP repeat-containing protein [Candidatus Angelobacter sp.]